MAARISKTIPSPTPACELTARSVVGALKKHASPTKAKTSARFFKTGPGEYGHGDRFIGVTVPEQRLVARTHRGLPLAEIEVLLESRTHEYRLTGLHILVAAFRSASAYGRSVIAGWYMAHLSRVNNWDLVDSSAPYILGEYLSDKDRAPLYRLVTSENIWERRVAMVATYAFIRKNEFADACAIAALLLDDRHDLMHKAVGWMLREVGKRSPRALASFLKKNGHRMPRTSLRCAIERLGPEERRRWMSVKARTS